MSTSISASCTVSPAGKLISVWTRDELVAEIALYKEASKALAHSKSYTIGSRQLTRSSLDEIKSWLSYLEDELAAIEEGGKGPKLVKTRVARPRPFFVSCARCSR